jgi:hypothetical protein
LLKVDLLILAAILAVVVLGLVTLSLRRRVLARQGGAIELSFRLKPEGKRGRGWVLGTGRFVGDDLQWFRVFSLSNRPRRTLSRRDLRVMDRREPVGAETYALLKGAEILELKSSAGVHEIALEPSAIMGFLAWLEARPPGATLPD